jgi:hypothetical protein
MTTKLVLGLAVGASAAVGAVAVTGHALSTPEVGGALAVAGVVAILNVRDNRIQARPHVLLPLSDASHTATVRATRARSLDAHPAQHSALHPVRHSDAA